MKKFVRLFLTATLAIALLLGLFQVVTGDSISGPARTCVGWNCRSISSTADAPQTALAITLPPLVRPLVGWNS